MGVTGERLDGGSSGPWAGERASPARPKNFLDSVKFYIGFDAKSLGTGKKHALKRF
jgi:hypothetical protein